MIAMANSLSNNGVTMESDLDRFGQRTYRPSTIQRTKYHLVSNDYIDCTRPAAPTPLPIQNNKIQQPARTLSFLPSSVYLLNKHALIYDSFSIFQRVKELCQRHPPKSVKYYFSEWSSNPRLPYDLLDRSCHSKISLALISIHHRSKQDFKSIPVNPLWFSNATVASSIIQTA